MTIERFFTSSEKHPFDEINWKLETSEIIASDGNIVFRQENVEVPEDWTSRAAKIVSSKYFYGKQGTLSRETSVKQLINRVTDTISSWGDDSGYFRDDEETRTFNEELKHILVTQKAAFNSPVWFNVGTPEPTSQASACFILSVEDSMKSILNWIVEEGTIFKRGSGAGTNLSKIRSSKEDLLAGGIASGPISFMAAADASAGAIKSGGTTRRAAKMVTLNIDHPDSLEFIWCKAKEEKKAHALIDAGFDAGFDVKDGAYSSIQFQNANNSIRVPDSFMEAVEKDDTWSTRFVCSGEEADVYSAKDLMMQIADATHQCGDPGMQFDTTINDWHTCKNSGRINASNPCSEYLFLDDTACNLASINLMKFYCQETGEFLIDAFLHTIGILITAQEIIVGSADYPTEKIAKNSARYRTLGLGYSNLGTLLMIQGLAYDSDSGRDYSAAITSLMTGEAYRVSAEIAGIVGPFSGYETNKHSMSEVIEKHQRHAEKLSSRHVPRELHKRAQRVWRDAIELGKKNGYRNAQVSTLAPTGTISFMMDCDTTGVEPDIALVKYKTLVGGGFLKLVNHSVHIALKKLGYTSAQIEDISSHIDKKDTIENAPHLKEEHLSVFDCSFKPMNGERSIHYMGHIKMLAAVQPFISGAISKTINLPNDATPDDIYQAYMKSWKLGLKCVAIYRDGCKKTQPLSTSLAKEKEKLRVPHRVKLPKTRQSITHKFVIGGAHEGYVTVGFYENGEPGEVFIVMSKEGTTMSGMMDTLATSISIGLQHGVPLSVFIRKFSYSKFEPAGFSDNPDVGYASSVVDYIFRWLEKVFAERNSTQLPENTTHLSISNSSKSTTSFVEEEDAPFCSNCGARMTRNASCYACQQCGETSGCS